MKKLISSLLVVVLLFNFISCNMIPVFAVGAEGEDSTGLSSTLTETEAPPSETAPSGILEEGEVSTTTGGATKKKTTLESAGSAVLGVVLGVLALLIDILALQVDLILAQLTYSTEYCNGSSKTQYFFSLERTVFNRVPLFDINFFNIEKDASGKTYTVGTKGSEYAREIEISSSINDIKSQVAYVYQITRFIAMIIGLLVLIYIGIRMALSTVASEQAKYKQMLISWVESVVLLFVMVYIMSLIMNLGSFLTNLFYNLEQSLLDSGTSEVFEDTVRSNVFLKIFENSGMELTIWSIMYWVLLFTQIKFFWLYIKRVLMVGFLIVISPLITITYAIDKVGDGKAQSFFVWFKEYTVNVLIQPLHALIYLVFILTANELAKTAPLLALLFLLSMGTVERMVKIIFNLRGLVTLRGVDKFMKKDK